MAKKTVKQRTVKRPAKSAAPATRSKRPVAKPARAAKAASTARAQPSAKKRVVIPKTVVRPALKKPIPSKPAGKSKKATLPVAKATPAAKLAAATAKAPPAVTKSAGVGLTKVATPKGLASTSKLAPAVAKPVVTKPATNGTPAFAEAKPTGRPMLSQGPYVGSSLTKRGTFAPDKLAAPAPKLPRKRPEPIVVATPVLPPPPPSIATGDKAAKNRAGLNQRDLDFFRDLLLAKRRELLGDMSSMEREALREGSSDLSTLPIHMADQGTDAYEQEFTLTLVEKDRTLLRELNNALAKIQNGSYGICEGTGLAISKPRLEAQPWAKYSIEHARAMEKKQMSFRR